MEIIGSKIKTEKGEGVIENIYLTELNLIMIKVRFNNFSDTSWVNYRLSELPEIKELILKSNER